MANYVSQVVTPKLGSEHLVKIKVPTGGLNAGSLVIADTLDATAGNISVFTATQPTTAALGSEFVAIVLNGGFETLSDGRRPEGQPNYYQYPFAAGDIADAVYLNRGLQFNIGLDCVTEATQSLAVVGNYLIPTDQTNVLVAATAVPDGTAKALKILALYNTPIGGNFGGVLSGGFASTLICMAV